VTVGTTPFDQLFEAVDQQFSPTEHSITCQISEGHYVPKGHSFFRVVDNYSELVKAADIVITHGGSATVFELLEADKSIVVVPNLIRIDKHQLELADFIEANQYACVCRDLSVLSKCLSSCQSNQYKPYQKEVFFMGREILGFFGIATK
jgi:beta-1,4-N-acetylglucosaminyltransferase